MAGPALVSFLGFPGWGPLHLQLPAPADPPALCRRLRRALADVDPAAGPGALLAAFLRQQGDARPLAVPWGALPAGGRSRSHRYRIVCGGSRRSVRVAAWCWRGAARGWQACGAAQPLAGFLARFESSAGASVLKWDAKRDPPCDGVRPGLRLSAESPPRPPAAPS